MLHTIEIYFLLFLTYAFLGWCMEVTCKLIQFKRFINRGFLVGPYCPIYGCGVILITLLLQKYADDVPLTFILSILICGTLEYLTSYVMEKIFKARWWDYSQRKFNINGRICLDTMIPFGILGVFIMYVSNPFFIDIYNSIPDIWLHIIAGILFTLYIIDNIVSSRIISSIHVEEEKIADNTEEITNEIATKIKQLLKQKSWLHRRLVNAYPNFRFEKLELIKERVEKQKQKIAKKLEKK